MRRSLTITTVAAVVAGLLSFAVPQASGTEPDPDHRVTICHRTRAANHPYVQITVDEASVNGEDQDPQSDHSHHDGAVATSTAVAQAIKDAGDKWGDIIPDVYTNGDPNNGAWIPQNWDTDGMTVFANGCKVADEGPQVGSITLTKTIPDVVEGSESYTIHFDLYDANDLVVGAGCDFVFTGLTPEDVNGDLSQTCTFSNLPYGSYTVKETDSAGFITVADISTSIPDQNGDVDLTFTVNNDFNPASAKVCKVTRTAPPRVNGSPAPSASFSFDLKDGDGNVLDTQTITTTGVPTADCATFNAVLEDDVAYTVVEKTPLAARWTSNGGDAGCTFTPQFPDNAGDVFTCTWTNTYNFSASLTPGYWKNHLADSVAPTGKNGPHPWYSADCKKLNGTSCNTNGPWAIQYLPQPLGAGYSVGTITRASSVFLQMNCGTTNYDAVGCLAGHLLAAELNVANGSDPCIQGTITSANAFLTSIGYTGPGTYKLNTAQLRTTALNLKNALDLYNNGGACPAP